MFDVAPDNKPQAKPLRRLVQIRVRYRYDDSTRHYINLVLQFLLGQFHLTSWEKSSAMLSREIVWVQGSVGDVADDFLKQLH